MRSCARRNFAAATSFMALVIFCVDSTDRIRRRMSRSVGMGSGTLGGLDAPRRHELRLGHGHGLRESLAQLVRQLLLVRDVGEQLCVLTLEVLMEELLERPYLIDR